MLAHPDYKVIQGMWHPTLNGDKLPADFLHKSKKKVSLHCQGCRHGCGRHHEWEARVDCLTRLSAQGEIVCPFCESRAGKFCMCQSVAADPRLSAEWHPDNPPATQVAKSSNAKCLWICLEGHAPYKATCTDRYTHDTGCPLCFQERIGKRNQPLLSIGRPDLAKEWDTENDRSSSKVTLGSHYMAWWRCSNNPEHSWPAMVVDRALKGTGCLECRETNRFRERIFGSAKRSC